MAQQKASVERKTKETDIHLELNFENREPLSLESPLPFFNHLLNAMAFHGGFSLRLKAEGDIEVDPHHLVEDTGLVLGEALRQIREEGPPLKRFGHFILPMDEALSEVTVDASGRAYLVYRADYPQPRSGDFPMELIKEFLKALSDRAGITLHASCLYGENSHHMAEALFKAMGKALAKAFQPSDSAAVPSTKGTLS